MTQRGRAMYDFEGDASQGELSFRAGADVTILRTDIGEGWWEGEVGGKTGLFPESYVEILDGEQQGGGGEDEDWESGGGEDWEEEEHQAAAAPGGAGSLAPPAHVARANSFATSSDTFGRVDTLKRSVNRFSAFVKAGAEGFLIGAVKDITIDTNNMIHVQEGVSGLVWVPNPNPYPEIVVEHGGNRKKNLVKSYEAFNIKGGGKSGEVERRYKHFEWLHDRLVNKYSCICVPPLPDTSFQSKYGETFLGKRQERLQAWINRVCRHPVLSRDVLSLKHFLTCPTSEEKTWKMGKRKAEQDKMVGATFFKLISQDVPCARNSHKEIDQFGAFIKEMDRAVRKNQDIATTHANRCSTGFKAEYKRIAEGFQALGQCFSQSGGQVNGDSVKLSLATVKLATTFEELANLWSDAPKTSELPFIEMLKEYTGLLGNFNDSIQSAKSASLKVAEIEENEIAGPQDREAVRARCDIIHTLTVCELNHFHQSRRMDFRDALIAYLQGKIEFQEKVTERLRAAKSEFERLNF